MIDIPLEYHVADIYVTTITCGDETAYYFIEGHERTLYHNSQELARALQHRADELYAKSNDKTKFDVTAYLKADWLERWAREFDVPMSSVQKENEEKQ